MSLLLFVASGSIENAVVLLEKKALDISQLEALLLQPETLQARQEMENDVYGVYHLLPAHEASLVNGQCHLLPIVYSIIFDS